MRALAPTLAIVLVVVALAPSGQAQKTPVKVGLLLSYTGVLGLYGPEKTKAIELYLKGAGDDIQLVREDDEGKPDVGLTKLRKLVERDRVNFLIGPVSSAVALAMRPGEAPLHTFRVTLGLKDREPADWSGRVSVVGGEVMELAAGD